MAKTLDDIFNDDEFGLLKPHEKASNTKTDEDRLIDSFEEINSFFERNSREPEKDSMSEYNLMAKLKGFRADEEKKKLLKPFDRFNLLGHVEIEKKTFSDILNDDEEGLLNTNGDISIFEFKHTPRPDKRAETDFIAQRQPIPEKDFIKYDLMFQQVHRDLKNGKRRTKKFDKLENNLQPDNFYLLDGLLLYLESAEVQQELRGVNTGGRVQLDGRTVTIFENGTKSNLLFRSLGKALQKDGRLITKPTDSYLTEFSENSNFLAEEDIQSGWVYILKSKSTNYQIAQLKDLYKIGFSISNIGERIKNASKEATYLFSDVELIATYRCYNLNTHGFENLIHRFFGATCLDIDIYDTENRRITPREWFIVPLEVINEAIELLISGEIVNYRYDTNDQKIIFK
ncbi:MAG: GIY-YIG nuclease family protein [Bacteroidetes bacterium]|nr:GIY-YIG nuclease family protein [Bacteroidota bacterium]